MIQSLPNLVVLKQVCRAGVQVQISRWLQDQATELGSAFEAFPQKARNFVSSLDASKA